eukprot:UC1_evm3s657
MSASRVTNVNWVAWRGGGLGLGLGGGQGVGWPAVVPLAVSTGYHQHHNRRHSGIHSGRPPPFLIVSRSTASGGATDVTAAAAAATAASVTHTSAATSSVVDGGVATTTTAVDLDDKYRIHGDGRRIFLTGVQALVRLPIVQRYRDAQAGLKTSGYITGYRGSPLGTLDAALWSAGNIIPANDIVFQPGLNEDLAATAVSGTQMVSCYGDTAENIDGVFSLWYGKGPGVDRSGDAIRHGNQMGSSANGGVLLCAGDDHVGKSSTTCHQSELALVDAGVPVLNPAGVAETLEYGLLGLSMSRYSGAWVGLKTTPDVMDSTSTVSTEHEDMIIHVPTPDVHTLPAGGVHARFPDDRFAQEERLLEAKLPAVAAFARANAIDRTVIIRGPRTRLGIVTTGKSYLDTRRALLNLGLTDERCQELGVALYKVGMPWPLEPEGFRNFAAGLEEVLVVEEKRAVLEPQITEQLFNLPAGERPQRVTGKRDGTGRPLLRSHLDLTSSHIAEAIVARLKASLGDDAPAKLASLGIIDNDDNGDTLSIVNDPTVDTTTTTTTITTAVAAPAAPPVKRAPFFCAGCPHNTSTQLPEGSHGLAGIGCSTLSMWMPGSGRETFSYSQMGGEGMHWVGAAPFSAHAHMFANLGDGTYTHSGLLAVRAAVAAKTNITYKILYNDAVAMTGGQPADGGFTVGQITKQLAAEGVNTIYVVSDDLDRHANRKEYAADTRFAHRRELEMVQLELREIPGVTALVYEQTCAAEKRRRRKRGTLEDPSARVVINADVCEGCGDCGAVSNCVAIQPLETPLGRKRQINQSSCNKDFSCIEGFCPSFVTVRGGQLRRSAGRIGTLKPHDVPPCSNPLAMRAMCGGDGDGDSGSDDNNIVFGAVTCGIGGTGVVTVGAVLAMAAHIEGKYATVLDDVGMSQKNGAVYSHLRIAAQRDGEAKSVRVSVGECDLLLATDMVAAADPEAVATVGDGGALKGTRCVLNTKEQMVGAFAFNPDMVFPGNELEGILHQAVGGKEHVYAADFDALARDLLGDTIMANAMSIGYAYQLGLLPLEWDSIEGAFEVNGVAVDANIQAFRWGRKLAHDPDSVLHLACKAAEATTAAAAVTAANARQGEVQQQQMKEAEVEEKEKEREEKEGEEREEEKSLESVITNRMRLLTEYQDEAYAAEYGKFVQRVIEAEQQQQAAAAATNTGTSSSSTTTVNTAAAAAAAAAASATVCETSPLALSVARGLSRLMAYKDEYEVARLYSSGHFEREVARQFVGDYHLEFHLSPPLLAPRDPVTGRPRKITLGPYTMSLFQALAPLKRLRGGPFDIFGRTEERKMERQLIKDYRAVINSMLDKLDAEKGVSKMNTQRALAAVLEYAKAAETIRGFGHVKEASVRRARRAQATAMAQFDDAVSSDSDNAAK